MRVVVKANRDFHGVVVESAGDHGHGYVDLDDGTKRQFFHSSELLLEEEVADIPLRKDPDPRAHSDKTDVEVTTRKSASVAPEKKRDKS
jgi:hypothetical protein